MKQNVPFFVPSIDANEIDLIDEVLNFERPNVVEELESTFSDLVGSSYALATTNGTSALHLALCALDLKRGDKVVCSVNAHPLLPETVRHFDAEPVFVDINEDDYTVDLDKLETIFEAHRTKKLKAVIFNHMGVALDMQTLYDLCDRYGVKVIEEASENLGGTTANGDTIGNSGAFITTFNFNPHLKGRMTNGGMLVTEDEAIYTRAKMLRNHGMELKDDDDPNQLEYIYNVLDIGCQYTMSELDAAFLLSNIQKTETKIARQREIAATYQEKLSNLPHITLPEFDENDTNSLFIVKIDKNRDTFARELKKNNIETGLHYMPMHLLSYYKNKYELRINDFPMALKVYQQILSLPIYEAMSDEDVEYVCKKVVEIAKRHI
jgi:dTDP-4-amino-4,6-dideoxygalactose transaminase